ncbi:MAG: CoA-binding protein [Alphaproteobacteria bacterium]|jgi:acetyltransferase|nr:CoA-binding protein [Alphaproteobacteria bacterium]
MNINNIENFFYAKSIAVVGASDREGSVGEILIRNIAEDFKGEIYPINPKRDEIKGLKAYKSISALPKAVDTVAICIPGKFIPAVIEECGQKGIKSAVIITDGLDMDIISEDGKNAFDAAKEMADKYGVRIAGPNCIGILAPNNNMNASFANIKALPGKIALVSESGAVACSVPDYATSVNVGFSHIFSLGEQMDLDFPTVVEYLENDDSCESMVLYMKKIHNKEKFLEVAKRVSKKKPIVLIKTASEEVDGVTTEDLENAGVVRIKSVNDIYTSLIMLNANVFPCKERVAVLTNSSGFSSISVQMFKDFGITLNDISKETKAKLDAILPPTWSQTNPVDIVGDATGERYAKTLEVLSEDPEIDTILTLYCPTNTYASEVAEEFSKVCKKSNKNVVCAFVGGQEVLKGRHIFYKNNIPVFRTPEGAVHVIINMSKLHGRYSK